MYSGKDTQTHFLTQEYKDLIRKKNNGLRYGYFTLWDLFYPMEHNCMLFLKMRSPSMIRILKKYLS